MDKTKPDLRVRSAGAAGAYAFQPLTDAGRQFAEGFAGTIKGGRWVNGTFWFPDDEASPYEVLRGVELVIVSGIGDTDEHDRPWIRNNEETAATISSTETKGE